MVVSDDLTNFNPRSPHRERPMMITADAPEDKFQSTLPSQGATRNRQVLLLSQKNFNPRSPHRERLRRRTGTNIYVYFNPRSPHRERPIRASRTHKGKRFQSTLPSQGATIIRCKFEQSMRDFNPRSPHRERPAKRSFPHTRVNFNPRSPHRERLQNH